MGNNENKQIAERLSAFGQRLHGKERGWKSAFARSLGITRQSLSQYLSGKISVGGVLLMRLRGLGADVDNILTGGELEVQHEPTLYRSDEEMWIFLTQLRITPKQRISPQTREQLVTQNRFNRILAPLPQAKRDLTEKFIRWLHEHSIEDARALMQIADRMQALPKKDRIKINVDKTFRI